MQPGNALRGTVLHAPGNGRLVLFALCAGRCRYRIGPGDQPGHVAPSVARQLEDRRIGPGLAQLSGGAPIVAHDNLATGIGFAPMQQTGEL